MKAQRLNILIVDDIKFVGEKLEERLIILNRKYHSDFLDIKPRFYKFNISKDLAESTNEIKELIVEKKVNYLVLDRRFIKIVDRSYLEERRGLPV